MTQIEMSYPAVCLYCGKRTGTFNCAEPNRKTVCGKCVYGAHRDEALEVAVGNRPWARPLSFWVGFFGQTPMPDEAARTAQAAWDKEQAEIIEFNRAHSSNLKII